MPVHNVLLSFIKGKSTIYNNPFYTKINFIGFSAYNIILLYICSKHKGIYSYICQTHSDHFQREDSYVLLYNLSVCLITQWYFCWEENSLILGLSLAFEAQHRLIWKRESCVLAQGPMVSSL